MKSKFNKSEIMKSAHRIYRNSWCTMSQALKEAWRRAKAAVKEREAGERKSLTCGRSSYDKKNAHSYRHVVFGRNDWSFDYGHIRF